LLADVTVAAVGLTLLSLICCGLVINRKLMDWDKRKNYFGVTILECA